MMSMLTDWLKLSTARTGPRSRSSRSLRYQATPATGAPGISTGRSCLRSPPGAIAGVYGGTRAMALTWSYGLTALGLGAQAVYTSVRGLQMGERVEIETT